MSIYQLYKGGKCPGKMGRDACAGYPRRVLCYVEIKKLSFPVDGRLKYGANCWRSIDGGRTFWYCGIGTLFPSLHDAILYKRGKESGNPPEMVD